MTERERSERGKHEVREPQGARLLADPMTDPDPRVTCLTCRHYRPHRCGNYIAAGLASPDAGSAFAVLLKWCPGWDVKHSHPLKRPGA